MATIQPLHAIPEIARWLNQHPDVAAELADQQSTVESFESQITAAWARLKAGIDRRSTVDRDLDAELDEERVSKLLVKRQKVVEEVEQLPGMRSRLDRQRSMAFLSYAGALYDRCMQTAHAHHAALPDSADARAVTRHFNSIQGGWEPGSTAAQQAMLDDRATLSQMGAEAAPNVEARDRAKFCAELICSRVCSIYQLTQTSQFTQGRDFVRWAHEHAARVEKAAANILAGGLPQQQIYAPAF